MLDEYFDYCKKFTEKYGDRTAVFIEKGSFYESYSLRLKNVNIGNTELLANILNIKLSKSNASKPHSETNPYMAGFPSHAYERNIERLLDYAFTIILIDQETENGEKKMSSNGGVSRKIRTILSPGTTFETDIVRNNYCLSIYLEHNKMKTGSSIHCIGVSIIDVTTGELYVNEMYDTHDDKNHAFDELNRYIDVYTPIELIISSYDKIYTTNYCKSNISINDTKTTFYLPNDDTSENTNVLLDEFRNPHYKDRIFEKAYIKLAQRVTNEYYDATSEILGIDKTIYIETSLAILIQYCYEHDPTIIERMRLPIFINDNSICRLENNCVRQLNIVNGSKSINDSFGLLTNKNKSLLDVVNYTSTAMGFRLLQQRLVSPIYDISVLNKRYDIVDFIKHSNIDEKLHFSLQQISDTEKISRRLLLKRITPYQLNNLYESMRIVFDVFSIKDVFTQMNIDIDKYRNLESWLKRFRETFVLDKLKKQYNSNITENIFHKNVNVELDGINDKLKFYEKNLQNIQLKLNDIFIENCSTLRGNKENSFIKLTYEPKEGYMIYSTNKRSQDLMKHRSKHEILKTLEIRNRKNTVGNKDVIYTSTDIENYQKQHLKFCMQLSTLIMKIYDEKLNDFNEIYDVILYFSHKIAELDVGNSTYILSKNYKYIRPVLYDSSSVGEKNCLYDKSFVNISKLRHPIIEQLEFMDKHFIPQNIHLGVKLKQSTHIQDGILLYGINSAGKSVTMKSLGLAVILAQAGLYVPCSKMLLSPYKKIMVRIEGGDNIYKGLSSFEVEMSELRNILKKHDRHSLVIGDEICHGTETHSAVAIVASAIKRLANKKTSFIFATHLHQLDEIEEVKILKNVEFYHIQIKEDEITRKIISRKLTHGIGEKAYGIEVCKRMNLDSKFIKDAYNIRHRLFEKNRSEYFVNPKRSRYNSSVFMDVCALCGKHAEHTHHILPRAEYEYSDKNHKKNLMPLCSKCHAKIHSES